MLVIYPDECIDYSVCEPESPAEAILSDTEPQADKWLELNIKLSEIRPNISEEPADADDYKDVEGKLEKYFKE